MKNRGFTLIELLAVLTILSIILLITVFSISSVISNSKNNLHNTQMEQILRAAEYYNSKEGTDYSVQIVSVKTLIEKGYLKNDEVKDPKTGKNIEGFVLIKYNGKKYSYEYREENICTSDSNDVSTTPGTKYECEVKDSTKHNFYILSENEDDTVNLIMDRNICNDGLPTDNTHSCTYPWYDNGDDNYNNGTNENGPVNAMTVVYNGTKDWTYIPNMELNYEDEGHIENSSYGYGKIETGVNGISITKSDNTESATITYDYGKKLKARLPKLSEVMGDGANCRIWESTAPNQNKDTCASWLISYLKTSDYSSTEDRLDNILGYWTLSSSSKGLSLARRVDYVADIYDGDVEFTIRNSVNMASGVRPVITVPASFLSNDN